MQDVNRVMKCMKIQRLHFVIFMGCNVSCPDAPSQYAENWGLDDPSGKSDEVFEETIKKIEVNILKLKNKLSKI